MAKYTTKVGDIIRMLVNTASEHKLGMKLPITLRMKGLGKDTDVHGNFFIETKDIHGLSVDKKKCTIVAYYEK
tara:strand:- start:87 stop:305 length:219 start_codon:yes stop_codon:yes gene_type:complete